MTEFLLITVFASLLGLIVGIMPGLGATFALIAMYPILLKWPAEWILIYYAALTMSSQFSGSVSALVFGILGEPTSYPAINERAELQKSNQIPIALLHTASASLIALIISLSMITVMWDWLLNIVYILRTESRLFLLLCIFFMSLLFSRNRYLLNFLMLFVGAILGIIGTPLNGKLLLTFDQWWLAGGIPLIVVLAGLVAIPGIIQVFSVQLSEQIDNNVSSNKSTPLSYKSIFRGSAIGSIVGLIPVIGNTLTSQIAWLIEKNKKSTALSRITAAEAANNSGNVTVLIPLLMFGIPVVTSEMVLYSILSVAGWSNALLDYKSVLQIFTAAIISGLIAWIFSGKLVSKLIVAFKTQYKLITVVAILASVASVIYIGITDYNLSFYLILLLISCIIGFVYSKKDFTPLIVGFLISPHLLNTINVFAQLYF